MEAVAYSRLVSSAYRPDASYAVWVDVMVDPLAIYLRMRIGPLGAEMVDTLTLPGIYMSEADAKAKAEKFCFPD